MSLKYKDNCWADKVKPNQDYEYLTDVEPNQFLVFDHKEKLFRIYHDTETKPKLLKVVRIENMPSKVEGVIAHPLMTKRSYPFVLVQAEGSVSLLRTMGVANTVNVASGKDEKKYEFADQRALLVAHSNTSRARRSVQASELHVFGCIEQEGNWVLWQNRVVILAQNTQVGGGAK